MDKADVDKAMVLHSLEMPQSEGIVVGTLGKAWNDTETLIKMVDAGMNFVRLRLSQQAGKYSEALAKGKPLDTSLDWLKETFKYRPHKKWKLLVDIRGRDITIGTFENDESYIECEIGEDLEIFIDVEGDVKSNHKRLVTSELGIDRILRKGDLIYIGDGQVKASVLSWEDGHVVIRTKSEGKIFEYSSIIIPDKHSTLSVIQERDIQDLEALNSVHKIDYLSIPYWSSDEDIKVVRRLLPFLDQTVILAKIEDNNIKILKEADGIIIQRRSLGLSLVSEKLFALQNFLIEQCKLNSKPWLISTEIIESMIEEKRPWRSEISDIQNSLIEGADGIILDKETSYGAHPIESISVVSSTFNEIKTIVDPDKKFDSLFSVCDFTDRNELLVMNLVKIVLDKDREPIDYIMTLSKQGKIASLLAKYALPIDVIAWWTDSRIVKRMNLVSGIKAIKVPNYTSKLLGADHLLNIVIRTNKSMGLGKEGNWIVVFRANEIEDDDQEEKDHYFKFVKVP